MRRNTLLGLVLAATALSGPVSAQDVPCGGSFSSFVQGLKDQAVAEGHDPATVERFFSGISKSEAVLKADRRQGIFQDPFITFSRKLISQNRLDTGLQKARQWSEVFDRIQSEYGIAPGVLLAFWAFETDYGGYQGDFNTANALVTLAHDCRRPEIFRPQVFSALTLYEQGDFDPATTTGAWAGEIGMVQMLPKDILERGVDGDGDGLVTLKTSQADALLSGARMLQHHGWRSGEPWLQEIVVPQNLDWSKTGLETEMTVAEWSRMGVQARTGSLPNGCVMASA